MSKPIEIPYTKQSFDLSWGKITNLDNLKFEFFLYLGFDVSKSIFYVLNYISNVLKSIFYVLNSI